MNRYQIASTALKRQVLRSTGLRNRELARDIGESETAVSAVLNYIRETKRVREKIAARCGMPVDELFDASIECMPARFRDRAA